MQNTLSLNIPQSSPAVSSYRIAWVDVIAGMGAADIWGRLGWRETRRRYRRTAFGPFWSTVSLALFVTTLGLVWSNLWNKDPKSYLPYLTSGMLCWVLFLTICTEGCGGFCTSYQTLIKQLRISYTLLTCAVVWRNVIVFFHNIIIYVLVCIYAGISVTWATLLVIPGFALLCLKLIGRAPFGKWETITFVAGLRHNKMVAPMVVEGAMNAEMFLAYIEQCLAPTLRRGDIVVMDNVGTHNAPAIREAIESKQASLRYLPKYSPDLNPIELSFSKFKALMRKASERTVPGLKRVIRSFLPSLSAQECANYFAHAGYVAL